MTSIYNFYLDVVFVYIITVRDWISKCKKEEENSRLLVRCRLGYTKIHVHRCIIIYQGCSFASSRCTTIVVDYKSREERMAGYSITWGRIFFPSFKVGMGGELYMHAPVIIW